MPTTVALPARDLDRLVKLCGLLTSDADGERATAARMASDLLRAHRLTWAELLAGKGVVVLREAPAAHASCPTCQERKAAQSSWREAVRFLHRAVLARPGLFNDWERRFVRSVQAQPRLSDKQRAVVDRLVQRVLDAGNDDDDE